MKGRNILSKQIKDLFVGKKAKMTIYILGVLWIAVVMQIAVNTLFRPENNILEAFVSTNSDVSSFELEMAADYGTGYLSEDDKRDLIIYVAGEMGLQVDQDVTINRDKEDCEVMIQKTSKNAETLIKLVSMEQKNTDGITQINHYLLVNLKIYKNMDSILDYRILLKDVFKNLKTTNLQTTMQLTANYNGKLSLDQMNSIADSMVNNLQGKIAYANRKEEMFTI